MMRQAEVAHVSMMEMEMAMSADLLIWMML